jgi:hypothetical protein
MDRLFATSGDWALGADNLQWVLYRRRGDGWRAMSFVSSTRDILERCLREKGCPEADRAVLLAALPPTFRQWRKATQTTPVALCDVS